MIIAGFRASRICRARFTLLVMLAMLLGATARADAGDATNEALLRLLEVLQQRGSITTQEHDAIKALAEAPPPSVTASPGVAPDLAPRLAATEKAVAEVQAATAGTPAPVVSRALAGKWYERLSLRGYTQFRREEVFSNAGRGPGSAGRSQRQPQRVVRSSAAAASCSAATSAIT